MGSAGASCWKSDLLPHRIFLAGDCRASGNDHPLHLPPPQERRQKGRWGGPALGLDNEGLETTAPAPTESEGAFKASDKTQPVSSQSFKWKCGLPSGNKAVLYCHLLPCESYPFAELTASILPQRPRDLGLGPRARRENRPFSDGSLGLARQWLENLEES